MALVASKLSRVAKQMRSYILKRHQEESRGRNGVADSPYDLDYLRELGLDDFAEDLESRLRTLAEADGEEDPDRGEPEPRSEQDVTADLVLPGAERQPEEDSEEEGQSEPGTTEESH